MKLKKGFALMNKKRLLEVCSRGGKTAHERGTAHRWNSDEAKLAGRLGGKHGNLSR